MKLRSYSKILAIALCLLLAPGASAAETVNQVEQPSQSGNAATAAPDTAPDSAGLLTADELSELSQRVEEPGQEVVGGALSNLHLTYIVIALAAAVIVLIAK